MTHRIVRNAFPFTWPILWRVARSFFRNATLTIALLISFPVMADSPLPAIASGKSHKALLLDVAKAGARLVAVGERGHIVYSDDAGKTWRQAAVPTRTLLTSVAFPTATLGWAVGHDGTILHSVNAGETWAVQRHQPFDPDAAIAAEDEALAAAEAAGIDIESDAGAAIGVAAAAKIGAALLDVWFADATHGFVVGGNGTLLETNDAGAHWVDHSARLNNPEGWHFNAIAALPGNASVLIVAGEKGTLFRSADGGASFKRLQPGYEGSLFGVLATKTDVLLFGLQGRLFRSTNGGVTWAALESGVTSGLNDGVALPDGTFVVGGNAGVVVSVAPGTGKVATVRRTDRQVVASLIAVDGGLLLVGDGGAKLAGPDGLKP